MCSVLKCLEVSKLDENLRKKRATPRAMRRATGRAVCLSTKSKVGAQEHQGHLRRATSLSFSSLLQETHGYFFSGQILWKCSWSMSLHIPRITRPGFADVESGSCRNTRQIPDTSTSSSDISRWSRHVQAAAQKYQTTEPTAQTSL